MNGSKSSITNHKSQILFVGGHSTPAFAVLDEILAYNVKRKTLLRQDLPVGLPLPLGRRGPVRDGRHGSGGQAYNVQRTTYNVLWVGEKHNQRGNKALSAEYQTVTEHYGLKFISLKSGKLVRSWRLKTFFKGVFELILLLWGFIRSFYIILRYKPDIVVSFGGFTAVPVVVNAKLFRKKVLTHEQTIVTGLANKIIARFADTICISWEQSTGYFPLEKIAFTGNPIRRDVFEIRSELFDALNPKLPTIYITGGNQGAHEINKRVFPILRQLLEKTNVVHQTGNSTITNDFIKAQRIKEQIDTDNLYPGRYVVRDYVGPKEIGEVMNRSDLILSRSGANTISEILALGKLSVLLPIPWASHDEQTKNARIVEELGLAKRLVQSKELQAQDVFEALDEGLRFAEKNKGFSGESLGEIQKEAEELLELNSSELIFEQIQKLLVSSAS